MRVYKAGGKKMKIMINGRTVKPVRQFTYLGSVITENCKRYEEVKRRITIGKEVFSKQG